MANPFVLEMEELYSDFDIYGHAGPGSSAQVEINEAVTTVPPVAGAMPAPRTNVRTDQACTFKFTWRTQGISTGLIVGSWVPRIYLTRLDAAAAPLTVGGGVSVAHNVSDPYNFDTTLTAAAGSIPAGLYKVSAALHLDGAGGPLSVAGFGDGPMIRVYTPM